MEIVAIKIQIGLCERLRLIAPSWLQAPRQGSARVSWAIEQFLKSKGVKPGNYDVGSKAGKSKPKKRPKKSKSKRRR